MRVPSLSSARRRSRSIYLLGAAHGRPAGRPARVGDRHAQPVRDLLLGRGARLRDADLPDRGLEPGAAVGARRSRRCAGGPSTWLRGARALHALHGRVRRSPPRPPGPSGPAGSGSGRWCWRRWPSRSAYLAWVPSFFNQRENKGIGAIEALAPALSPHVGRDDAARTCCRASPSPSCATCPGARRSPSSSECCGRRAWRWLVSARRRSRPRAGTPEQLLLLLVALATPVGRGALLARQHGPAPAAQPGRVVLRHRARAGVARDLAAAPRRARGRRDPARCAGASGPFRSLGDELRRPAWQGRRELRGLDRRAPGDALVYSTRGR